MKKIYNPRLLAAALILSLILPVAILTYTEHNPFWEAVTALLLPLGFYTLLAALSRRSGAMVWWSFPFIFFSAFQVVLSYLFGNSVVAADMFLNLTTTNPARRASCWRISTPRSLPYALYICPCCGLAWSICAGISYWMM